MYEKDPVPDYEPVPVLDSSTHRPVLTKISTDL